MFKELLTSVFDPRDVHFFADGASLYICERYRLRKLNVHSGTVTTIAGDGESGDDDGIGTNAQFKFPHGLALTTDDATLYVAGGPSGSTGRGTVRAVDTGDLTVVHVAGLVLTFWNCVGRCCWCAQARSHYVTLRSCFLGRP